MTKATKIANADAAFTAAIEARYAAQAAFLASGTQADLNALNAAKVAQEDASAALALLGR